MGSIGPFGVQKLFCTIFGGRDISRSKWGIRFQKFEIMIDLISLNLPPPRLMHNFSNYEYFRRRGHVPFKR